MPLRQGESIGAYEIITPLGQGGMATVYRAYHPRLNRYVAIKMIHQAYVDDPNFLARFEREAQIIAALEHPHIVPVYDFSEHAGEPYLVMKLIEGSTLKAKIKQAPLLPDEILAIVTPVAAALDYAHQQGVLHRDIKPSNIILDSASTPYLTDFGLARLAVAGDSTISQDMMIGTPYYISPEQARGKGEVDYRSDLYSFGVVLYELLTGKVPFSGGTPYAILNDHMYEPLPLPSSLNPAIQPPVEAVLLQALAKDPADRYPSAVALVAALRAAMQQPIAEPPVAESDTQPVAVYTVAAPPLPTPPANPAVPPVLPVKRSRRRLWLWTGWIIGMGAAGALVALLVSVLIIAPNRQNNRATATLPAPALYDVPTLTHDQARAAIVANPDDPLGYLALVRVQLDANDLRGIRRTITEGINAIDDDSRFELTAADLALQTSHPDAAFVIYANILAQAEGTANYPAVRAATGEALYRLASNTANLRPAQLLALNAELESLTSPLVKAMVARAMLSTGNTRLAQSNIANALASNPPLAEAHLVNGELQQPDAQAARREWETARDAPDAPSWVRDRAAQLLQSLT